MPNMMRNPSEFRHRDIVVRGAQMHVVEAGPFESERTLVLLHGWPEDSSEFEPIMSLACEDVRVVAFDLPGIGRSKTVLASGVKSHIAQYVLGAIEALGLRGVTLAGH